jgi:hypothetical protein
MLLTLSEGNQVSSRSHLCVLKRSQRVCRLSTLADEDARVVPEDGAAAVKQVTGQLQHHWHLNHLFNL